MSFLRRVDGSPSNVAPEWQSHSRGFLGVRREKGTTRRPACGSAYTRPHHVDERTRPERDAGAVLSVVSHGVRGGGAHARSGDRAAGGGAGALLRLRPLQLRAARPPPACATARHGGPARPLVAARRSQSAAAPTGRTA